MNWLESLILGAVQGVTEFLPVSSDGHLTVVQFLFAHLQGRTVSGAENKFFDVMLHLGTLAAIIVHYREAVATGVRGLLGSTDVPPEFRRASVVRVGLLAFVATLPLIPDALFLKKLIEQAFQSLTATGVGFLITAAVLGLTLRLSGGQKGPAQTTWLDALLIGIAQAFAPLPGVSRSGLTIAAALALGFSRTWSVGFSLLMAVPAILGAAVFEIKDVDPATLTGDRLAQIVAATVLAGLVGYAAIVWLVRIVRGGRLWYFSVYLIILGLVVLAIALNQGVRPDARGSEAMDRPIRGGVAGPGAGARAGRAVGSMDRGDAAGPGAGRASVDLPAQGRVWAAGLVLGRPLARGRGRP